MRPTRTQNMAMVAVMAAVMAIISPHSLYIGPVPLSLGIFGVALTAGLLPPLLSCTSLSVYLLLGFIGLPVFTGYRGGPQVLLGPTGGYLLGYFALALAIALAIKFKNHLVVNIGAGYAGMAVCYFFGTLWYVVSTGATWASGFAVCVAPFILPDLVKIALALVVARELARRMGASKRGAA